MEGESKMSSSTSDSESDNGNVNESQEVTGSSQRSDLTGGGSDEVIIGVIQMCATHDKDSNRNFCIEQIKLAKKAGATMVFLPEAFDYVGRCNEETVALAETLDGPLIKCYQQLAESQDIWISLGGFHQRVPFVREDGLGYVSNTHVLIDDFGKIVSTYDKIHLFDMMSPVDGVCMKESMTTFPGSQIQYPVATPIGGVGLGICYDVRFPEMAVKLRSMNAKVLTYPSAFTVPTGRAHWETLLRARAIDNQCFVIAAAQCGRHNEKRESYGHSMVVDPWGVVIAEAGEDDNLLIVPISLSKLYSVRETLPVFLNRRPCTYRIDCDQRLSLPLLEYGEHVIPFGHILIKKHMTFLESEHSVAFVNKKCVVPGHVLVITKRPAPTLIDLSTAEVSDLFQLVRQVEQIMQSYQKCSSTTISVQDGVDAGQTVRHIHVHVLPRKPMDFAQNDDIYKKVHGHEKDEAIPWRSDVVMMKEANLIRNHIHENFESIFLSKLPPIKDVCTRETEIITID